MSGQPLAPQPPCKPVIGLLGGTFNPIHNGHLQMATQAQSLLALDEVRLIPNRLPPHKGEVGVSAEQRLQMVELATQGLNAIVVDDCELNRQKPSYTVDTLAEFRQRLPDASLNFIIGMDSLLSFDRWHQYQRILELANLVVCRRQGEPSFPALAETLQARLSDDPQRIQQQPHGVILLTDITPMALSSTQVRHGLSHAEFAEHWLPEPVLRFIRDNRLYNLGAAPANKV